MVRSAPLQGNPLTPQNYSPSSTRIIENPEILRQNGESSPHATESHEDTQQREADGNMGPFSSSIKLEEVGGSYHGQDIMNVTTLNTVDSYHHPHIPNTVLNDSPLLYSIYR